MIGGSSRVSIQNSTISSNEWDGIEMVGSAQATIHDSAISNNGWNGIEMMNSAQAFIRNNKIVNKGWYGVACYQQPCFYDAPERFEGAVRDQNNEISGNKKADFCPTELEFLKTSTGGCYGQKC